MVGKAAEIQPEMLKALNRGVLWLAFVCQVPGGLEGQREIGKLE